MKHWIVALFLAAGFGMARPASATGVRWFGHACFQITSDAGTRVLVDPFDASVGYKVPAVPAELVLVTHEHSDHNNVAAATGQQVVLHGLRMDSSAKKVKDVTVRAVRTKHFAAAADKARGENTVFVLEVDGMRLVHCGDLGHTLTPDQVRAIGKVDILMVPVGGVYTINGAGAAQVAKQVKARVILPMHMGTALTRLPLDDLSSFMAAARTAGWDMRTAKGKTIPFSRGTLPAQTTVMVNIW